MSNNEIAFELIVAAIAQSRIILFILHVYLWNSDTIEFMVYVPSMWIFQRVLLTGGVPSHYFHLPIILNTKLAFPLAPCPTLVAVQVWVPPSLEVTAPRVMILIVESSLAS